MVRGWTLLALFLAASPLSIPQELSPARLIYQVKPVYPAEAKAARIQGTVRLWALIDRKGEVARLRLISGHPFLVKAAMDAVKQWRWRPPYIMGAPVEFVTEISVPFSLNVGERGPVVYVSTSPQTARLSPHNWSCRL